MPDDARERIRRAQHPGHRRQAHPADPQRHEHRRRGRHLRPGDRRARASHLQHRRRQGRYLVGSQGRRHRRPSLAALEHYRLLVPPATCSRPSRRRSCSACGPDDAIITVATDGGAALPLRAMRTKTPRPTGSAAPSTPSTPVPCSASTSAPRWRRRGRHDRVQLDTRPVAIASSTSATTPGSSSRAPTVRRPSNPGAPSRSGGRSAPTTCGVWDETDRRVQRTRRRTGGRARARTCDDVAAVPRLR